MTTQDFTTTITVDNTPAEVFNSLNNVKAWWTENLIGNTQAEGDEFEVRFGDLHYSKQKLTDVVPHKKVVWLVTDSNLSFLTNKEEWTGTKIIFDITPRENQTELRLTHIGLQPDIECFEACSGGWSKYMANSLFCLLTMGKGQPGFPPAQPC